VGELLNVVERPGHTRGRITPLFFLKGFDVVRQISNSHRDLGLVQLLCGFKIGPPNGHFSRAVHGSVTPLLSTFETYAEGNLPPYRRIRVVKSGGLRYGGGNGPVPFRSVSWQTAQC
jgi:hypothetical protein